jgi:hypothetical protein
VSVVPLPLHGEWFTDAREGDRRLRVSWHTERDVVVLSTWRDGVCVSTTRLTPAEAGRLVAALAAGLAALAQPTPVEPGQRSGAAGTSWARS